MSSTLLKLLSVTLGYIVSYEICTKLLLGKLYLFSLANPKLDWLKSGKFLPSKSIRHEDENAKMVVSNQFGNNVENAKVALSK